MKSSLFLLFLVGILFLLNSCEDSYVNYTEDIKLILDRSCAYTGCHGGSSAGILVTSASKDFTNYEGLLRTIENGAFKLRVLDDKDMPPSIAWDSNPKFLTEVEQQLIRDWLDCDYPK